METTKLTTTIGIMSAITFILFLVTEDAKYMFMAIYSIIVYGIFLFYDIYIYGKIRRTGV